MIAGLAFPWASRLPLSRYFVPDWALWYVVASTGARVVNWLEKFPGSLKLLAGSEQSLSVPGPPAYPVPHLDIFDSAFGSNEVEKNKRKMGWKHQRLNNDINVTLEWGDYKTGLPFGDIMRYCFFECHAPPLLGSLNQYATLIDDASWKPSS